MSDLEVPEPVPVPAESAAQTLLWAALRLLGIVVATLAAIGVLLIVTCYGIAFLGGRTG